MSAFRKDPFGSAWVAISPERGLTASDFGSVRPSLGPSPLAPGKDPSLIEVDARRPSGSRRDQPDWTIRVVRHPAALLQAATPAVLGEPPFQQASAAGRQELIIEHPDAQARLERYSKDHLIELLRVWRERIAYLAADPETPHLQLVRSVGTAAGAAYDHPHAVLSAAAVPNRWLLDERAAAKAHHAESGRCLFCEVAEREIELRERVIAMNDHYLAFAPWASKTPFETWIVPRRHGSSFAAEPINALPDLAEMLAKAVGALVTALADPPYNLLLHTVAARDDASFHWHLELLPRLTRRAGFDWSTGHFVNPTPPEDAARFLREASVLKAAR